MDAIRFIEGQSPMHEEFINLPNRLAQLVVPAPDNAEIHMDPISINDNEYESSSDDMEFDKASLLAPIIDDDKFDCSCASNSHFAFQLFRLTTRCLLFLCPGTPDGNFCPHLYFHPTTRVQG
jgi:hypothetical protein